MVVRHCVHVACDGALVGGKRSFLQHCELIIFKVHCKNKTDVRLRLEIRLATLIEDGRLSSDQTKAECTANLIVRMQNVSRHANYHIPNSMNTFSNQKKSMNTFDQKKKQHEYAHEHLYR